MNNHERKLKTALEFCFCDLGKPQDYGANSYDRMHRLMQAAYDDGRDFTDLQGNEVYPAEDYHDFGHALYHAGIFYEALTEFEQQLTP